MSDLNNKNGVWFIYDGECPICTHAAEALRIKQEYGALFTIDARTNSTDILIEEINRLGLDLDEGMVIYASNQFYHGKDALKFMARFGESRNPFMAFLKGLFWSDFFSKIAYPWMRAGRNWMLKKKGVGRIDNLEFKNEPIFKSVFGKSWNELPPVLIKHYANRPYTNDETAVKGRLEVMCKPPLLWLAPIMKFLGQIPAYNESDVPVTVRFRSDLNSKSFQFNRTFEFQNSNPYKFQSVMVQTQDDQISEIMRFGFVWKTSFSWDGEKVVMSHQGFALKIFGHFVPLPLTYLIGSGYGEERAVDDNSFDMEVHITHPVFGRIYGYKGRFEVSN